MILQTLNELYDRLADDPAYEIAPPGFSPQKISFRLVLKPDGTLVQIADARIKDNRGKFFPDRIEVPAHEKRTSGVKPQFLCDKTEYVLGWTADPAKQALAENCFSAFRDFHLAQEQEINSTAFSAICRFLEKWTPDQAASHPILAEVGSNFCIWVLQGEKRGIHEDGSVKSWWISRQTSDSGEDTKSQCLVSGASAAICRIHPDIKGFKSSIALVGIQENTSYESYGLSKTENCPVSSEVAFRYATALNALTDGPKRKRHRTRIANTSVVHWTQTATVFEDIFASAFSDSSETSEEAQDPTRIAQINRLLEAIKSGTRFQELGDPKTPFFILGLEQPNPGRFAIRFFHRSTIADLVAKLHHHHECMKLVRQFTEASGSKFPDPEFPAVWQVLRETARVADEIPPLLGGALTRSIVEGTHYPEGLFSAIIRRIQADRTINYLRAATLKAVLVRNHQLTIPTMLDTANTDPAYLLGRLFAALEKTQDDALGNVNAGIRDRFYSAASSTPASVFPRLLRTYQHWLSKLNGGAKVNRDRLVQEILSLIDSTGFPNQFPLKKQGIFAIGYYHQRKDFFTKKDTPSDSSDAQ